MLPFRLRPPPRTFLSRAYNSSSPLNKPIVARPYLWWLKARYRKDGTRRSILRGIYFGACYVAVIYIAYYRYPKIKAKEYSNAKLSDVVKLQRMHRKYRTSSFTEPAEVKAYLTELAEFETDPRISKMILEYCEEYDAVLENAPEHCERVRERIRDLRDLLVNGTKAFREFRISGLDSFFEMTAEVDKAIRKLELEIVQSHSFHVTKPLLEHVKLSQELGEHIEKEREKSKEERS